MAELLDPEFGDEWRTFVALGSGRTSSGHRTILGARLYNRVCQRFDLGPNDTVAVDGVLVSAPLIAAWMGPSQGTILNWRTIEQRRANILAKLDNIVAPTPRHDRFRRVLMSLEGAQADGLVTKQKELENYLILCDSALSS